MGSKEWWQSKIFLFVFLLIGAFVLSPNATTRGMYCGFGFTSYCSEDSPRRIDAMKPGDTINMNGYKIERIN